jgi:hypothetical protein
LLGLLGIALVGSGGCGKKPAERPVNGAAQAATEEPGLARQLALARVDAATTWLREHAPDRALATAVAALTSDPECAEAAALARRILAETQWNLPALEFRHELPVTQVVCSPPESLWVGLAEATAEGVGTAVRWNTAGMKLESVLFPATGMPSRSMVLGDKDRTLVVQRGPGSKAVELLCDAQSLRPIREVEPLPDGLTGPAVTVSSANGLLLARPGVGEDGQGVWQIRDAATGEIIRSSEPLTGDQARPVAAHLDAKRLRVVRADGSLWDFPVSPVEAAVVYRAATPLTVLQGRFSADGTTALLLLGQGDGCAPVRQQGTFQVAGNDDAPVATWLAAATAPDPAWWEGVAWSRESSWWDHLLRDHGNPADPPAIRVAAQKVVFCRPSRAPIWEAEPLTAVAIRQDTVVTGTARGVVRMHRLLPLPRTVAAPPDSRLNPAALADLCAALTGLRFDQTRLEWTRLGDIERRRLVAQLDPAAGLTLVPGLDLEPVLKAARECGWQTAPAATLLPLWDRLARADQSGRSWPRWLALGQALGDTRWHQDLSEAVARRKAAGPVAVRADDSSPWLAQERMREVFARHDEAALKAELQAAGGKGPAAATALALAIDGDSPDWLEACLQSATDLPPLLRVLGESRRAWLQNRLADAVSMWPDEFPSFEKRRLREDWDGWEQADFAPRYEAHLKDLKGELATYEAPPQATPVERAALAARLLDPATRGIIGRRRLADNCLKAALAMTEAQDDPAVIFQLASRARALGVAPAPCLRAEALALTRLKEFAEAHPRWITLLTEHPVTTHQAADYAEAAYTAFENGDPNQAIEILGTGINRFPDDAGFALRAGWIALLTANYGRGYHFLLAGLRIGYPEDKRENACLLLTVAANLAGFPEEAITHFANLVEMAPVWEDAATVEALEWPEDLKTALWQMLPLP